MKDILEKIMNEFINSDDHFCSEADFQFSLAWRIKEELKNVEIILEYPIENKENTNQHIYIDICVIHNNKKHFIELKYKTTRVAFKKHDIPFKLTTQSAHDLGRYHFCKDIERLEKMKNKGCHNYAIFLTNDPAYVSKPKHSETLDKNFRIHEGSELKKGIPLEWNTPKSNCNAEKPHWTSSYDTIEFNNDYTCKWNTNEKATKSYLLLKIKPNNNSN